jgi:hypothetical protein
VKKPYCTQNNGDCPSCSLSSYGRDCQNNPIGSIGARDLTDRQRELFAAAFYMLWDTRELGPPDLESPRPWGCPWTWGDGNDPPTSEDLTGATIEEMAANHMSEWRSEIIHQIQTGYKEEE